jgi:hypothetical protein
MIDAYVEQAPAPMFLSGLFQSPEKNFHNAEEVEIDVQRDSEEVAIVIQDLTTGARQNAAGKYTNKSFKPPIYNEEGTITAFDLLKRQPGKNPFEDVEVQALATVKAFGLFNKLTDKVDRAIELQASQVLSTGELILTDAAGIALYSLDFKPKSTHFVTPTAWAADGSSGDPLGTVASLGGVLRKDGRKRPDRLIFGGGAYPRFMANTVVKANIASLGMQNQIQVTPNLPGADGASFMGFVWIANYRYEMWLYEGSYIHPQTGVLTPYVADNKVLMMSSKARLDITFGTIPRLVRPEQRVLPFLPSRISGPGRGIDLSTYAWVTQDGLHLKVSAGTRPLVIPTEVDTFGALTVY